MSQKFVCVHPRTIHKGVLVLDMSLGMSKYSIMPFFCDISPLLQI